MKQLLTLVVLFGVLVLGYIFLRQVSEPSAFEAPAELSLQNFVRDDFTRIVFKFPSAGDVFLKKDGGVWTVNGFAAEATKVEQLLVALDKAEVSSLVSTNPDNHKRFQVDESTGVTMEVSFVDADTEVYVLGKSAGGQSTYVRKPEQPDVFVMDGLARFSITEAEDSWRDRKIVSASSEMIRKVVFEGAQSWEVVFEEEKWLLKRQFVADVELDTSKVDNWLKSLAAISASGFKVLEEGDRDKKPVQTITLELGDAEAFSGKEVLTVFEAVDDEQSYLILKEDDESGYLIYKTTLDGVYEPLVDLLERLQPEVE